MTDPAAPADQNLERLRRFIRLDATDGRVDAQVEDDVHDFQVVVLHDGVRVSGISGRAVRFPWTTCPAGPDRLSALVGAPLSQPSAAIADAAQHCTHLLDLAKLALAQARRGGSRLYDLDISLAPDRAAKAGLRRDGEELLRWDVVDDAVFTAGDFEGHRTIGRAVWSKAIKADPELLEAALILRRGLLVFWGRLRGGSRIDRASEQHEMRGACLTYQPGVVERAIRPTRFADRPISRPAASRRVPSRA